MKIIGVILKFHRRYLAVMSIYAPKEGKKDEPKTFNQELQKYIKKANQDFILLMKPLNARIKKDPSIPRLIMYVTK